MSYSAKAVAMPKRVLTLFGVAVLFCLSTCGVAARRRDVADGVMNGDEAGLRALLQQEANVNAAQGDGARGVDWGVYGDDVGSVGLLIAAGAAADVRNRDGITPLYLAS